jgi:hypothetical protein
MLSAFCSLKGVHKATSDDVVVRRVGYLSSFNIFCSMGNRYNVKGAVER